LLKCTHAELRQHSARSRHAEVQKVQWVRQAEMEKGSGSEVQKKQWVVIHSVIQISECEAAFSIRHSACEFSIQHSAFCIQHSAFQQSECEAAFSIQDSA
jgi:hypothetical protein